MVGPARQQSLEHTSGGALANRDASSDPDYIWDTLSTSIQELLSGGASSENCSNVQVHETGEGKIDGLHLV